MKERVVDAVRRLGDGWWRSKLLPAGFWTNKQEEIRMQRPDLVDAMIFRQRNRK